ncbi:MAG: hypothetical protein AAFS10_19535 [Myxococcota bacterium]
MAWAAMRTIGLHVRDVQVRVLQIVVDARHTVLLAEHDTNFMAQTG